MAFGRRGRITGSEAVVVQTTNEKLTGEMKWFYDQVKTFRGKIADEAIAKREAEMEERGICHLSDICHLFGWGKGTHTELRNKLAHVSYILLMAHHGSADTADILFKAMKRALKDDVQNPVDLVLSKKEGRKARKLRKSLEKNGIDIAKKLKLPKSDDAKAAARRERQRIRKAAKAARMTTEAYKAKMAESKAS